MDPQGIPVHWTTGPPAPFYHGNCRVEGPQLEAWTELRSRYLATGTIQLARDPRFMSHTFLIPKKDGGWRLVVDLRHVNRHCSAWHTHYETLQTFLPQLQPGQHLVGWDIRNAFHHLRVEERFVRYFQFQINGETFECPSLSFGWRNSPPAFTKALRPLVAFLRAPRIAAPRRPKGALGTYWDANPAPVLSPYLDDFAGEMLTALQTHKWGRLTRAVLDQLNITIKESKCTWTPTQVYPHLGVILDTAKGMVLAPPARVARI